jgi:vacuolar protein sorting-associated protein 33B
MNRFMTGYLNTFGHKHLHIFHNLFKAKLFPDFLRPGPKNLIAMASNLTKKTPFMSDAIKLKLIPGSESEALAGSKQKETKACPSYVFNGNYIPLVAQLAQIILKSESFVELSGKLGSFNMKASFNDELKALKDIQSTKTFPLKTKTLFIFIVGGITYAEVAACNMIESLTGSKIVLASDEITCGTNIIKAASL